MDRQIERKLADRAVELGKSGDGAALNELIDLLTKPSAQVRRLAASAIGKLAGLTDAEKSVDILIPMLQDDHPQVRQYVIKALSAYGAAAEPALKDIDDTAANTSEKEYNQRDAVKAGEVIREALRIKEVQAEHVCRRCGAKVHHDEYAQSQKAFQRVFCGNCFDEVYLDRRNFDTKVELNKIISTKEKTLVQSHGERVIADYLDENSIEYRYDEKFRILDGYAVRPDFYLPEFDIYIEYWGMDTADYKIGMLKKQKLYQQQGKKVISTDFKQIKNLKEVLAQKLSRYVKM